jgi:molecular chaperone GrpE (heat shock protein)
VAIESVQDERSQEQLGVDPPDAGSRLERVLERLEALERAVAEFQQRSAHREAVIDRLHEENQRLQAGFERALLEPLLVDLVRLHDGLTRQARGPAPKAADWAGLLTSFADEVEQLLERCGVESFSAEPGDPHRPQEHRPVGTVATQDEGRHNTVAEVLALGFRERETGRVYRPLGARFFQYRPS